MRFIPAVVRPVSLAAAALLFPLVFSPHLRAQAPSSTPAPTDGQAPSAPAASPAAATSPAVPRTEAQPAAQSSPEANAQGKSDASGTSNTQGTSNASTSTVIDYTGSLLGYYRMEIGESAAAPGPTLEPVRKFLAYRSSAQGKDRLLLGMGDNFGPEFGASLQMENDTPVGHAMGCFQTAPPSGGEARPESLYKDDDRVALKAQCDNVLNFMMQAGFRAIVPGSQDFMYTARWLRSSALRLQEAAGDAQQSQLTHNRDNRLDMLGANLRIAMKGGRGGGQDKGGAQGRDESQHPGESAGQAGAQSNPDGPSSGNAGGGHAGGNGGGMLCPLLFAPDPFSRGATRCVNDMSAPEPLDWLDRLDRLSRQSGANPTLIALQELASDSNLQAKGRQSQLDSVVRDEISIMESAWGQRFAVPALGGPHGARGAANSGDDLDETEVSNLAAQLSALPDCQSASTPGDDRGDLCVYATRLGHILRCRNLLIHQAPNTGPRGQGNNQSATPQGDACPAGASAGAVNANGTPLRVRGSDLTLTETERDAARRGLLRSIAFEERNVGYTLATTGNGRKVLVIGVAGQDTMEAVSATNLRLCRAQPGNASGGDVFGKCGDREAYGPGANAGGYTVVVTDPVQATQAIVRGASLVEGHFDSVVVMAQMPHTEAEVLAERVSARLRLAGPGQGSQPVDIVLSEAESSYGSPQLTLTYPDPTQDNYPAPVLTPRNSYSSEPTKYVYPGAVSELTLTPAAGNSYTVDNRPSNIFNPPTLNADAKGSAGNIRTTITLLYQLMDCLQKNRAQSSVPAAGNGAASSGQNAGDPSPSGSSFDACLAAPPAPGFYGTDTASSQKAEFALLRDMQEASRSMQQAGKPRRPDVVLLQSRDVELDEMGSGYMGYEMCDNETQENLHNLCMVRSALDRIFWKGDYVAYVAVTGKDLINILNLSEQKMAEQAELSDTGYTREWLITYGIVQSALTNVTELSRNNEPLWIPVDPNCKGDSPMQSTYCIGGTPIANDSYYWLLTTDQLAQDKAVYGTLDALSAPQHQPTEMFVTAPLAHYLLRSLHGPIAQDMALMPPSAPIAHPGTPSARNNPSAEQVVTYNNEVFQQTRLFQVDFSKIVASFSSRQPVGGNGFVANFQGVSDSRATAPGQQELDLEAASRITSNAPAFLANGHSVPPMSFGVQTAFGYDRSVLGNLQGRPINPSFSLNNLTVGAFLQIRLHRQQPGDPVTAVRSIPRSLLVFTPRQYQVQINHQYLFFPTANSSPQAGELTVTLPRNDLWTDRAGFREEFGRNRPTALFSAGSYFETGFELSSQDNVLASLTLQDGTGAPVTCNVSPKVTLQSCFTAAALQIIKCKPGVACNATAVVGQPGVKTLHTPGFYWQLHIQNRLIGKQPGKSFSLVTDSQGDYYTGRPNNLELPTQTEYAIPLSVSVLFPSIGNLSFAPSYSGFFYKSQLSDNSLQVNSFSIAARWYFARDARVPVRRQAKLTGPASADQTRTGKAH